MPPKRKRKKKPKREPYNNGGSQSHLINFDSNSESVQADQISNTPISPPIPAMEQEPSFFNLHARKIESENIQKNLFLEIRQFFNHGKKSPSQISAITMKPPTVKALIAIQCECHRVLVIPINQIGILQNGYEQEPPDLIKNSKGEN